MLKKIIALRLSDYNTIDYFRSLDIQFKVRFLSRHSLSLISLAYIGNLFFFPFFFSSPSFSFPQKSSSLDFILHASARLRKNICIVE